MKVHNVIVHEEKNLSDAVKERMVHATFLENSLNKDTLLCMTSNVEQYLVQFHLQHITKVLIKICYQNGQRGMIFLLHIFGPT